MMFEKQCKSGVDKLKASSSAMESPPDFSVDAIQNSPEESQKEASQADNGKTGADPVESSPTPLEESSRKLGEKQKSPETKASGNLEPDVDCNLSSQPSKRSKVEEGDERSVELALH